jgi:hypothetical protein
VDKNSGNMILTVPPESAKFPESAIENPREAGSFRRSALFSFFVK